MLTGDPKVMSEEQVSAFYVLKESAFGASKKKKVNICICIQVYTFISVNIKVRKIQRLKPFYWRLEAIIPAMSLPIFLHQGFERFVSIVLTVIL